MNCNNCNGIKLTNLTTEQLVEPLGINCTPRFSYKVQCAKNGAKQESVHIRVYSSKQMLQAGTADMWDEVIKGNVMSLIEYKGEPLVSYHRYFWTAEVTDTLGNCGISEAASFVTGIMDNNWSAKFMGPDTHTYHLNKALYCRSEIEVKEGLKNAYILLCGIGYHVLRVNGIKQGDAVLEPGFTRYDRRCQYVMHDITSQLSQGENVIGVILGDGWYNNDHEVFDRFGFPNGSKTLTWLGKPRYSYQIYLEYENRSELLLSDENSGITMGCGAITFNNIFDGEHYDARLESDWDKLGGGIGFRKAAVYPAPCSIIEPELSEPQKVIRTMTPVSVTSPCEGSYVYDFGQNFSGWVRIKTAAKRGTEITLRFAEMLYDNGEVNQENLRWADSKDKYVCNGKPSQWEPTFTYHGFRYVQMEGVTPDEVELIGCVVRSAAEFGGQFSCSNELINKIQKCVVWTEESNMPSVPTDCPQRDERQGWLNDCTVRVWEMYYNFAVGPFMRKWIKDIADTQEEDGSIKDVAPRVFGADKADPLSSVYLFVPWLNYLFCGDKRIIQENYEGLKKWEQFITNNSHFGIVDYSHYGDWAGPVEGCVGDWALSVITPGTFISTVYYYENARVLAKMANILGKNDEAVKYEQLADYIRTSINREWFNKETAQYANGSQATNIMAIAFEIVAPEYKDRVLANIVEDIKAHNYHLTTGNIATKYLFDVLSENGYCDVALAIATKEDYPSWGYMFKMGATTIWERWEHGTTCAMNSHNHPMYGTISAWFYKHLAGIAPTSPAFETVTIAPKLASGLDDASAIVHSVRGDVASGWKRTAEGIHMDVILPLGTTADICIPEGYKVKEMTTDGVVEQNGSVITVCSGRYALELVRE